MLNPIVQAEILATVWQRSRGEPATGDYVFLSTIRDGVFHEGDALDWGYLHIYNEIDQPAGADLYFTPQRFIKPERKTEALGETGVLYADLDDGYDRKALEQYPPSVLWETSPNNLQAIWFLDFPLDAEAHAELNHRMSQYMRADKSSWIPTKLLRVPGSVNYKRGGVHGKLLSYRPGLEYSVMTLSKELPELRLPGVRLGVTVPDVPTPDEWRAVLDEIWPDLTLSIRAKLSDTRVVDRSLHLAQLTAAMAAISIPPEVIFAVLSRLPANKFRDRPEVLWTAVVLPISEAKGLEKNSGTPAS